jgi:hypothetical protein
MMYALEMYDGSALDVQALWSHTALETTVQCVYIRSSLSNAVTSCYDLIESISISTLINDDRLHSKYITDRLWARRLGSIILH